MELIPEWAPNVHPLIIHFPIVLWVVAVFWDAILQFKSAPWISNMVVTLYVLGAIASVAAYFSGKQAMDMVSVPMQGELTAGNHSDWGHFTLYFFLAYAVVRFFIFWKQWDQKKMVAIALFILGVVGLGMVAKTADLGAKLVYKYGVGISK